MSLGHGNTSPDVCIGDTEVLFIPPISRFFTLWLYYLPRDYIFAIWYGITTSFLIVHLNPWRHPTSPTYFISNDSLSATNIKHLQQPPGLAHFIKRSKFC
jgi:hypothetical protein